MLEIVKDVTTADAITHGGVFHADEVMATALILRFHSDLKIARMNQVPEDYSGLVFDVGYGRYDHHQKGKNGKRKDGVYYASAGLIWKTFGKGILEKHGIRNVEKAFDRIDRKLMEPIDFIDNGMENISMMPVYSLSDAITACNPQWDEEDVDWDDCFRTAVDMAELVLDREIRREASIQEAEGIVEKALGEVEDGIMELEGRLPWKDVLEGHPGKEKVFFVVGKSERGGYNVVCVPPDGEPFAQRKSIPIEWRGKSPAEYEKMGLSGMRFVHDAGFFAVADTKEHAIEFAKRCLESE